MARRHLTQEQKQKLARVRLTLPPERSDRQIAGELGISPTTVGTIRKHLETSGEVSRLDTSIGADGKEYPRTRKAPEPESAAQEVADEPAPQENGNDFMNGPTPDMQKPTEPEDIPEENETPAREMRAAEDMLMGLEDEAKRLRRVLKMMLNDYEGNEDMEEMLFSHNDVKAARKGLSEIQEVLDEYEELVRLWNMFYTQLRELFCQHFLREHVALTTAPSGILPVVFRERV